jgi:hypothetical protein
MAIYLVQSETSGLVKIGYAANVKKRLRLLQTGSADRLRLLRLLEGGRAEEAGLHRRFAQHRKRGEWFSLPDDVAAGPLDLPDLPLPDDGAPKNKGGRPRLGDDVLTPAQRKARQREREAARLAYLEAEVARLTALVDTLSCVT